MIINDGGIATSRVLEQEKGSAWVRVRLRDVFTPRLEDTDHAKESQATL